MAGDSSPPPAGTLEVFQTFLRTADAAAHLKTHTWETLARAAVWDSLHQSPPLPPMYTEGPLIFQSKHLTKKSEQSKSRGHHQIE